MRQILYPGAKIPEGYNQNPAGDVELTTGPGPIEKAGYRGPQPTEQQIEALASGRITNEELFNQLNPPPEPTSLAVPSMDRLSAQRPGVPTTGFQPAGRVPSPQYGQPQSQGIRPQNNYRLMPPPRRNRQPRRSLRQGLYLKECLIGPSLFQNYPLNYNGTKTSTYAPGWNKSPASSGPSACSHTYTSAHQAGHCRLYDDCRGHPGGADRDWLFRGRDISPLPARNREVEKRSHKVHHRLWARDSQGSH